MSNLLETIGRGVSNATGLTAGNPNPALDAARDERGKQLIKQLVTGGLATGGGVGLGVALANLVNSLNKEQEIYDPSTLNSGTLYVPLHKGKEHEKQASLFPYVAPGIALAGGVTGAALGYSAVQNLWEKIQKARRQKILDDAQSEALAAADQELTTKEAAQKFSLSDTLTGVPVATALLAALATGGVTTAALNKAFPTIKHPRNLRPKRVRLVTDSGEQLPVSQEELNEIDAPDPNKEVGYIKEAAFSDDEACGREFATSLVTRLRPTGLTSAMVNMISRRGVGELERVVKSAGVEVLETVTRGWENKDVSVRDKQLAVMAMHKNAYMSEIGNMITVAELLDTIPNTIVHAVGNGSPSRMEKCAGIASLLGLAARQQNLPEFAQAPAPPTNASPQDYQHALEGQTEKEEADAGLTSDVGGSLADSDASDNNEEAPEDDDDVDTLMTGKQPMNVG